MRILIMANGDYGEIGWYQPFKETFDRVILVDGGGNWAEKIGIIPHQVVGDMDSITDEARTYAAFQGAEFMVVPPEKDDTDTQLALQMAEAEGASEVVIWGGIGWRLDHTLSNLFSAASLLRKGIKVRFESSQETIYLTDRGLTLEGQMGETVSVIALAGDALGVTMRGFRYPLTKATLDCRWQQAVSNIIVDYLPTIEVESGVIAVIHYRGRIE